MPPIDEERDWSRLAPSDVFWIQDELVMESPLASPDDASATPRLTGIDPRRFSDPATALRAAIPAAPAAAQTAINALDCLPEADGPARPGTAHSNRSAGSFRSSRSSSSSSLSSVYTAPTSPLSPRSSVASFPSPSPPPPPLIAPTAVRKSFFGTIKRKKSQSPPPRSIAAALPDAILGHIFRRLRAAHEAPHALSCPSCLARDLCSVSLVSRSWSRAARAELYRRVCLDGPDAPAQCKRLKLPLGSRLVLLRRTLRAAPALAACVVELRVWHPTLPEAQTQRYLDLVATVVMACPRLEALTGLYPLHDHTYSRLVHALATRRRLRQHLWMLGANAEVTARSHEQLPPGLLDAAQADLFRAAHDRWRGLSTLALCATPGAILEHGVLTALWARLPRLAHLSLANLDEDDFTDATLVALPPLTSLRLANLAGVTPAGLAAFAARPPPYARLARLALVDLPVPTLLTIPKLLASPRLTHFALAQAVVPALPPNTLVLPPLMASRSLECLHWDVRPPPRPPTAPQEGRDDDDHDDEMAADEGVEEDTATPHLARAIHAGAFPRLRYIRAPRDDGSLQSLCAPRRDLATPADRLAQAAGRIPAAAAPPPLPPPRRDPEATGGSSRPVSRHGPPASHDSAPPSPLTTVPSRASTAAAATVDAPPGLALAAARLRAQARADAARAGKVGVKVRVWSPGGALVERWDFPGWLGTVNGVARRYVLNGTVGCDGAERMLVDEADVLGMDDRAGEDGGRECVRGGCTGAEARGRGGRGGGHVERWRWRGAELEGLFWAG